jgi:hypothetical protein
MSSSDDDFLFKRRRRRTMGVPVRKTINLSLFKRTSAPAIRPIPTGKKVAKPAIIASKWADSSSDEDYADFTMDDMNQVIDDLSDGDNDGDAEEEEEEEEEKSRAVPAKKAIPASKIQSQPVPGTAEEEIDYRTDNMIMKSTNKADYELQQDIIKYRAAKAKAKEAPKKDEVAPVVSDAVSDAATKRHNEKRPTIMKMEKEISTITTKIEKLKDKNKVIDETIANLKKELVIRAREEKKQDGRLRVKMHYDTLIDEREKAQAKIDKTIQTGEEEVKTIRTKLYEFEMDEMSHVHPGAAAAVAAPAAGKEEEAAHPGLATIYNQLTEEDSLRWWIDEDFNVDIIKLVDPQSDMLDSGEFMNAMNFYKMATAVHKSGEGKIEKFNEENPSSPITQEEYNTFFSTLNDAQNDTQLKAYSKYKELYKKQKEADDIAQERSKENAEIGANDEDEDDADVYDEIQSEIEDRRRHRETPDSTKADVKNLSHDFSKIDSLEAARNFAISHGLNTSRSSTSDKLAALKHLSDNIGALMKKSPDKSISVFTSGSYSITSPHRIPSVEKIKAKIDNRIKAMELAQSKASSSSSSSSKPKASSSNKKIEDLKSTFQTYRLNKSTTSKGSLRPTSDDDDDDAMRRAGTSKTKRTHVKKTASNTFSMSPDKRGTAKKRDK